LKELSLKTNLLKILTKFICLFIVLTANISISYAITGGEYGVGRLRTCDSNGHTESLHYDYFTGGDDALFDLSNPFCFSYYTAHYAYTTAAIAAMNAICGTGSKYPRLHPSPVQDSLDIAAATIKAATKADSACTGAISKASSGHSVAVATMASIYGTADGVYRSTRICGHNWKGSSAKNYDYSASDYEEKVYDEVMKDIRKGRLEDLDLSNKNYREFYYGGEEVEDNAGSGHTCLDPTRDDKPQRYYMRGTEPGNFNCEKYRLVGGVNDPTTGKPVNQKKIDDYKAAYECCKNRSQKFICIDYKPLKDFNSADFQLTDDHQVFCKVGELCVIEGVTFEAYMIDDGRMICAQSYSLCPYNFTISGGTEYCDYYKDGRFNDATGRWDLITTEDIENEQCDSKSEIRNGDCSYNEKAGKCRNYCQYLTHCVATASESFPYRSSLTSPYFSTACLNFIGDSQNKTAYDGGIILGSQKHFSAPIAQCVRETIENVFYNRVGHTTCLSASEFPSQDGECPSGTYAFTQDGFRYQVGNQAKKMSFFEYIQSNLQKIVKLVLVVSVTLLGANILIGKTNVGNRKEIVIYLLKIAIVMYFATGNAWQSTFFEGVYKASSTISEIIFKVNAGYDERKRDGCQFGTITLPNGEIEVLHKYPKGKEYLAVWDTLDCKITRYLGYGPEASSANIASLIFAGMFTGSIGLYFSLALLFFGFFFIALTIRALHIFLSSAIAIIIMVFVSPIIFPTILFEKTKSIFKAWTKQLISVSLQPILLFAYIAITITILDKVLIGSATFHGTPPYKITDCDEVCIDSIGNPVPLKDDDSDPDCDEEGQVWIDPKNDSVACLINFDDYKNFAGFEIVAMPIPVIDSLLDNPREKILTLLKAMLCVYLIYKFMDEISKITSALIGGEALGSGNADAIKMFKQVAGGVRAIQKRLAGAGKQGAKAAYKNRDTGIKAVRDLMSSKSKGGGSSSGGTESGSNT